MVNLRLRFIALFLSMVMAAPGIAIANYQEGQPIVRMPSCEKARPFFQQISDTSKSDKQLIAIIENFLHTKLFYLGSADISDIKESYSSCLPSEKRVLKISELLSRLQLQTLAPAREAFTIPNCEKLNMFPNYDKKNEIDTSEFSAIFEEYFGSPITLLSSDYLSKLEEQFMTCYEESQGIFSSLQWDHGRGMGHLWKKMQRQALEKAKAPISKANSKIYRQEKRIEKEIREKKYQNLIAVVLKKYKKLAPPESFLLSSIKLVQRTSTSYKCSVIELYDALRKNDLSWRKADNYWILTTLITDTITHKITKIEFAFEYQPNEKVAVLNRMFLNGIEQPSIVIRPTIMPTFNIIDFKRNL